MTRLALLHLSDLHFDDGHSETIFRASHIAASVFSSIPAFTHVLVLITGDIVDKGNVLGYQWASEFLKELEHAFRNLNEHVVLLPTLAVPGNHDLVRPQEDESFFTWDKARDDLYRSTEPCTLNTLLNIRSRAQQPFFEFAAPLTPQVPRPLEESHLPYTIHLDCDDLKLSVECFNTSFMCKDDSDYGRLLVCLNDPTPPRPDYLRIAIMHHPPVWLKRSIQKKFHRRLFESADIVLSGHEHEQDDFVTHRTGEPEHAFFEGDALQGPGGGFATIVFDSEIQMRKTYCFTWDRTSYVLTSDRPYSPMRRGVGGPADGFLTSESFSEFLEDSGIFDNSTRTTVPLNQVYVYPKLRDAGFELRTRADRQGPAVATGSTPPSAHDQPVKKSSKGQIVLSSVFSAQEIAENINHVKRIMIVGERKAGKTVLLKQCYSDLRALGYIPLWLKPTDCSDSSVDAIYASIRKRAQEQYDDVNGQRFLEVPLSRRVILVDEIHTLKVTSNELVTLLKNLARFSEATIVTGDELYLLRQAFAAVNAIELLDFKMYRLLELDPHQRKQLANKVYRVLHGRQEEDALYDGLNSLDTRVDAVMGENLISSFAGEFIEVVKQFVLDPQGNATEGAFGFYYDAQIKVDLKSGMNALPKDVLQPQVDLIDAFLSRIAFRLYKDQRIVIGEGDIDAVIDELRAERHALSRDVLVRVLKECRMFVQRDGDYVFRERYQRFYFMARYLEGLIGDRRRRDEADAILQELIEAIESRESSDVLLFVLYLTSDTWLMQQLSDRANRIFADIETCDMDSAYEFLGTSPDTVRNLVNEIPDSMENTPLRSDTSSKRAEGDSSDLDDQVQRTMALMSEAFNILSILGLAVRNYPGRIPLDLRKEMVVCSRNLSFRVLSAFLELLSDGREEFALLMQRHLRLSTASVSKRNVTPELGSMLMMSYLASVCSFGVIRRLASAFASPQLALLLSDVFGQSAEIPDRLIDATVSLTLRRGNPELTRLKRDLQKNPVAELVLAYLVGNYLRSYKVTRERRIALCNAVGLNPSDPSFYYDPVRPRALG